MNFFVFGVMFCLTLLGVLGWGRALALEGQLQALEKRVQALEEHAWNKAPAP